MFCPRPSVPPEHVAKVNEMLNLGNSNAAVFYAREHGFDLKTFTYDLHSGSLHSRLVPALKYFSLWLGETEPQNIGIRKFGPPDVDPSRPFQDVLSPREMETVTMAASGMSNDAIAEKWGTTHQVVKNCLATVYDKSGLSSIRPDAHAARLDLVVKYAREWCAGIYPDASCPAQCLVDFSDFTLLEQDVLQMLIDGKCNKEIAETLRVQPRTVKKYLKSMLAKTGLKNRYELAVAAVIQDRSNYVDQEMQGLPTWPLEQHAAHSQTMVAQ